MRVHCFINPDLQVHPIIIKRIYSFLTNRIQQIKVNGFLSTMKYCNTGVPQGCVSSPLLFTLYTNDCRSTQPNCYVISDDTIVISLLHASDCPSACGWCDSHYLMLNINKTKEMIFDSRNVCVHHPMNLNNSVIEQVSYKYLGIMVDNNLCWSVQVDSLCVKLAQRLHFLRRLRLYGVCTEIMLTFYKAVMEIIVICDMAAWLGALTVQSTSRLMYMIKITMKVMGMKNLHQPL